MTGWLLTQHRVIDDVNHVSQYGNPVIYIDLTSSHALILMAKSQLLVNSDLLRIQIVFYHFQLCNNIRAKRREKYISIKYLDKNLLLILFLL